MDQVKVTILATVQKIPGAEDLSHAIEQTLNKRPDEEVRCVRVFDDRYRCNWWVRDRATDSKPFLMGTISKSKWLRVRKTADGLLINDTNRSQ